MKNPAMTEIWLAFIAGLAGSGHCLGMCGESSPPWP